MRKVSRSKGCNFLGCVLKSTLQKEEQKNKKDSMRDSRYKKLYVILSEFARPLRFFIMTNY